jgi:hypothetical protein
VEVSPGEYRSAAAPSPEAIATITRWLADHDLALAELRTGRQSLEDVFVRLTDGSVDGSAVEGSVGGSLDEGRAG